MQLAVSSVIQRSLWLILALLLYVPASDVLHYTTTAGVSAFSPLLGRMLSSKMTTMKTSYVNPHDCHQSSAGNIITLHASGGGNLDGMNGNSNKNSNDSVDGSFLELTSALAKASESTVRNTQWTKLVLPPQETDDDDERNNRDENNTSPYRGGQQSSSSSSSSSSTIPQVPIKEEYVWMLEPADVAKGLRVEPSCTILFTGGAGLGSYPHVAYNELLQRIANKLNAVIIAAPYTIGLDHFALAKDTGEKLRRGVDAYNELKSTTSTEGSDFESGRRRPVYALAHSLGCKLQTIYLAATRQEYDGYAFMAFNNFSFAQTIQMARSFTEELRKTSSRRGVGLNMNDATAGMGGSNNDWMKNIFDFAEVALSAVGIDFSPNANDMNRLIQLRYNYNYQSKTRLFVMDDDNMDSSSDFLQDCRIQRSSSSADNNNGGVTVSGIPGGHLAPVYFQWNLDDTMSAASEYGSIDDLPPEARDMAREAMGGFQGASFGDEVALNALVEEICGWIMGRPPSRGPNSSTNRDNSSSYRIAGG
jgi:hypothetical protein